MGKITSPAQGIIKNRMKILLAERDMSIKDFAEAAGFHYTTAQRFCSGDQQNVSLPILAKVCETLEVNVGDILEYIPGDN